MKKIIKSLLLHFGLVVFKRSSRVYLPEEDSYRIVVDLCGKKNPIIFDGGAHHGESVVSFSSYAPLATFYCFEPDPVSLDILRKRFSGQSKITIIDAALGEKSLIAELNINVSRPTNSLLAISRNIPLSLSQMCQTIEKIKINVLSIDDYCHENNLNKVDILKLDLQGYDYKALLGGKKILQGVSVILMEVWFAEIYTGAELFQDVLLLMTKHGFRLHTICGLHYGDRDELLWGDAIFIRPEVS